MANTAPAAILCGDPARALAIAQHLIPEPRMSNHHRGLWGYYGITAAGDPLTVHATGIGGPSGAVVLSELARRGLQLAIRVGTATSDRREPGVGALALVREAVAGDGASAAYGAEPGESLAPDPELSERLAPGTDVEVAVRSLDRPPAGAVGEVPAERADAGGREPGARDLVVYDLQTAALLAAARQLGVRLAAALVISRDPRGPLEDDPLESASLRLAAAAAKSLSGPSGPSDLSGLSGRSAQSGTPSTSSRA
jgi:uridine phosphorylase